MGMDHQSVEVASRADLRAWLSANHQQTESIWLVTWRKPDPRYFGYDAIVEECLCFGWVDSLPRRLDDTRTMLRLSPRNPRSAWSEINRRRVAALEAQGLIMPAGHAAIATARANGQWSRLDAVERLETPPDLAAALDAIENARGFFDAFPRSIKRGILEWIEQARTNETRQRRVRETARVAGMNERANQFRKPRSHHQS